MNERFDETKSHLSVKIESVDSKVALALEGIVALREHKTASDKAPGLPDVYSSAAGSSSD
jgi:hypothetical protein